MLLLSSARLWRCAGRRPQRAQGTTALLFVTDPAVRESIQLDVSAATRDLEIGEWKGATVLAGSAIEALLLWALQDAERRMAHFLAATVAGAVASLASLRSVDKSARRSRGSRQPFWSRRTAWGVRC